MVSTVKDVSQVLGNIKNVAENYDVLFPLVQRMSACGRVDTPAVDDITPLVVEFYSETGFPDTANLEALAHQDAWGIKRCLTLVRRKWSRAETPKDRRAAKLVELYDKAFSSFLMAGGDAASIVRADTDDDDTDPYIVPEESDSSAPPLGASEDSVAIMDVDSVPSAGIDAGPPEALALPEAPASEVHGFPEHYSSDDIEPRCLESLLREFDSPVEAHEEPSSSSSGLDLDKVKDLQLYIAAGASKLSQLFPTSKIA
ncbi:unnamed protein product [Symbiodinium microadriaticum]|nr:unnamed protein product [Symbiodinium microadriaticum]